MTQSRATTLALKGGTRSIGKRPTRPLYRKRDDHLGLVVRHSPLFIMMCYLKDERWTSRIFEAVVSSHGCLEPSLAYLLAESSRSPSLSSIARLSCHHGLSVQGQWVYIGGSFSKHISFHVSNCRVAAAEELEVRWRWKRSDSARRIIIT